MTIYVSNCGSDENGGASGGTAGDQTGKEWVLKALSGSWTYVFRHSDADICTLIAQLAIEAAENDLIGYDQSQRLTFWTQLSASGYYPSKITTACEADCSSGVAAIVKAVGYLKSDSKLKGLSTSMYTGNESSCLTGVGFTRYSYTGSSMLQNGDILLRSGHTTIVAKGASTPSSSSSTSTSSSSTLDVDGKWGVATTTALQTILGTTVDGIVSSQDAQYKASNPGLRPASWQWKTSGATGSKVIKTMQGKLGVTQDGYFGPVTCKALQKRMGTTQDGYISNPSQCVKALQKKLNSGAF